MASLQCQKCELQCDDGLRLSKVLPCGHTACLACLEECARTDGSMCPVCRKVIKSNIDELATLQNPNENQMWCCDCEAEARAACFEQHALCGLGRMQRETADELQAAWDGRAALLHTLAEDVRAEEQQLKQERDSNTGSSQQQQLGLAALRGALAFAKEHPLHGLQGLEPSGLPQGGLLRRALGALRREEELRAREAAVREDTRAERETNRDKTVSPRSSDQEVTAAKTGVPGSSFEASSTALGDAAARQSAACAAVPAPAALQRAQPSPSASESDDSSAQTVPGMDSLPEELLQHILALLPLWWTAREHGPLVVPDLLSLRLVCRRWARSVLSPAVWRHRELDYNYWLTPPARQSLGLLQQVPIVGTLSCYVDNNCEEELQALMNSPMQVRALKLNVQVTDAACHLVKRLLDAKPCEELHLTLWRSYPSMTKTAWLLQQVDRLQGLKALTLGHVAERSVTICQGPLKHLFWQLKGLTKLSLGGNLHLDTVRSMLEASKLRLRELDCGRYDVAQMVASTASQLRIIRVTRDGISANLTHLRDLKHLEVAHITQDGFFSSFASRDSVEESNIIIQYLNSSPSVPREVHLTLEDFQALHHWNTVHGMRRVSHLNIGCRASHIVGKTKEYHGLTAPLTLPDVIKLEVDLDHNENAWQGFRAVWLDSTAPKLREVHVAQGGWKECCLPCKEWLEVLREQRPSVKIYCS